MLRRIQMLLPLVLCSVLLLLYLSLYPQAIDSYSDTLRDYPPNPSEYHEEYPDIHSNKLFDPSLASPQHPSPKDLFNANAINYPALRPFSFVTIFQPSTDSPHLFLAVRHLVWSLLWNPQSRSRYPVTVYVTDAIDPKQIDQLRQEGAIVKRILPADFHGSLSFGDGNLLKVNLWQQGEFTRLVFLDPHVFVLRNIDALFDTPAQPCPLNSRLNSLSKKCKYTFATDADAHGNISGHLMVIKTNDHLHKHLISVAGHIRGSNQELSDWAVINAVFNQNADFPFSPLGSSTLQNVDSSSTAPLNTTSLAIHAGLQPSFAYTTMWNQSLQQMTAFYSQKMLKDKQVKLSKAFRAAKKKNIKHEGLWWVGAGSWRKWGYVSQ